MSSLAASSPDLQVPSPPQVLASLIREASNEDRVSMSRLSELCTADPNVAVEILRLVNSPAYYRGDRVVSVQRAVAVLGVRALRNLAICTAARACASAERLGGFDLRAFWEDSLRRAVAAQLLAVRQPESGWEPSEAFTAGLLQDLGLIALVQTFPDRAQRWSEGAAEDPGARRRREVELFGVPHDAVLPQLAERWELPTELSVPLVHHHDPSSAPEGWGPRCRLLCQAELLASVLSCADRRGALDRARQVLALDMGMSAGAVDDLVDALARQVEETARALGMEVQAQPSLEEILRSANRSLIALNMSYEDLVKKLERTVAEKEELARELARRNRELEQLSLSDALTGMPNRRAFSGRLAYEVARTARSGGELVVLLGDVDKFKSVNDTWGHEFGDTVLKSVAARMSESVRQTDMAARVGGEEFAVILPGTDRAGGLVVAEKILQALRGQALATPTGERRAFTISLGMVWVQGPVSGPVDTAAMASRIYRVADKALYASKEGGRDRVTEVPQPLPWTT